MIPLLIGTYTKGKSEGIYQVNFDPVSKTFSTPSCVAKLPNPSFLAPISSHYCLAISELSTSDWGQEGVISLLKRKTKEDHFEICCQIGSGGKNPCFISFHPSWQLALIANYSSGNYTLIRVDCSREILQRVNCIQHAGKGAHPRRQEAPHAHMILPMPVGPLVVVTDLGTDSVVSYRLSLETKGKVEYRKHQELQLQPGSGPRHLIFHPQYPCAFLVNELSSTLVFFHYAKHSGILSPMEEIPLLPEAWNGENISADVKISPCGRWIVASNRGHESVTVFRFYPERFSLEKTGVYSCGGAHPRNISFDPSGQFLFVANQYSNYVSALRFHGKWGSLTDIGCRVEVGTPSFVLPI